MAWIHQQSFVVPVYVCQPTCLKSSGHLVISKIISSYQTPCIACPSAGFVAITQSRSFYPYVFTGVPGNHKTVHKCLLQHSAEHA